MTVGPPILHCEVLAVYIAFVAKTLMQPSEKMREAVSGTTTYNPHYTDVRPLGSGADREESRRRQAAEKREKLPPLHVSS
jgi:hypothetical protein